MDMKIWAMPPLLAAALVPPLLADYFALLQKLKWFKLMDTCSTQHSFHDLHYALTPLWPAFCSELDFLSWCHLYFITSNSVCLVIRVQLLFWLSF